MANASELKERYFNDWVVNTANNIHNNVYSDLIEHVPLPKTENSILVEFGCGNGVSTIELAKLGYRVIVLECNEFCANACFNLLEENDISVIRATISNYQALLKSTKARVLVIEGVVCGRGRNPTLRLWPTIFSGKIDVFPGDRRSRLISSMTSVAPA